MLVNRGYKTELKLNNKQRTACLNHAGASRFAYNWGLNRKECAYRMNFLPVPTVSIPTAFDLNREIVMLKNNGVLGWLTEVSKCAPQMVLQNLDEAFRYFFRYIKQGGEEKVGYPCYKSKRYGVGSFSFTGSIVVEEDRIRLPRIGWVRLKECGYIPMGKWSRATVSEKAGHCFVSVFVKEERKPLSTLGGVVGVDLGVKHLAVCSDGTTFKNPKALARYQRKLNRQHKSLDRKKKGSKNRRKSVRQLQKTYVRVTNIRQDNLHKATSWLAKNKQTICLEDLNVLGMMKNHYLAKSIFDVGLGEFKRQMKYKSEWYGSELVFADRWFPSSKTCSKCGHVRDELKLSERTFHCPKCGNSIDRDLNASLNLEMVAVSSTETLNACGEESSSLPILGGETISMKQELDRKPKVFIGSGERKPIQQCVFNKTNIQCILFS